MNLNSVLILAHKVTTTEDLFEESKGDLNRPTFGEDQADYIHRNVQQIGSDSKNAIAIDSAGTTTVLTTGSVRIDFDTDHPHAVIEIGAFRKLYNLIADNFV